MTRTTAITACPLDCFGVCSFKATTEDGRLVSLEPNTGNPVTGNTICSKGRSHIERMNDPKRIVEPMRRTDAGWETVSWEEAYAILTDKITTCLNTEGHESIASYMGGGAAGKLKGAMELFFQHLGGGTVFTGGLCWAAGIKAQALDFGKVVSHSPEDLLNARTLVFWGKNPADTHFHLLPWVTKARKNGCKVILIDPVTSATAAFADMVVRPLPGTDWALALAVMQGILAKGWEHAEAAAAITAQDPRLLETISKQDTAELLAACGVSKEELHSLVEAYGYRKPCATYMGYGLQRHPSGGNAVRLIDLLGYLSGQVGVAGGGVSYANKVNSDLFDLSWAGPKTPPQVREFQQGNFGPHLLGASNPPVRLLFIACGNPAVQMPDSAAVAKALQAVETVVVIDHFMTDTAQLADLFLPATYFLEEEDVVTSGMWNSTLHYNPQVAAPRGEARSELRIFSELAAQLGIDGFPQLSTAQWLERMLAPAKEKGISFDELKAKGWLPSPNRVDIPWQDQRFLTENGAFNPISTDAVRTMTGGLPEHAEPGTLPFISFHRRDSINSQHTRNQPPAVPEALIHPDTAEQLGLTSGDAVRLVSPYGSLKAIVRTQTTLRPGIVAMTQGSWKQNGASLNDLAPSGVSDIGEQALLNAFRVRIEKG